MRSQSDSPKMILYLGPEKHICLPSLYVLVCFLMYLFRKPFKTAILDDGNTRPRRSFLRACLILRDVVFIIIFVVFFQNIGQHGYPGRREP